MALSTCHIGAEEDGEGVGEIVQRHAGITEEVTGCSVVSAVFLLVPHLASSSQHLESQLIPGGIFADLLLKPVYIRHAANVVAATEIILHAEYLGEVIEHIAGVAGAVEKHVDQLRALVLGRIFDERRRLIVTRNTASDVKINATDELLVVARSVKVGDRLFADFQAFRVGSNEALGNKAVNGGGRLSNRGIGEIGGLAFGTTGSSRGRSGGLHLLGERLIFRREIGKREAVHVSISRLKGDVVSFDADKRRSDLAAADVCPSADFRQSGTSKQRREKDAAEQFCGLFHS